MLNFCCKYFFRIDLNSNEVIVNDTSRAETANADNPSLVDSRLPLTFDVTAAEGNEKPFACVVYNAAGDEIRKSTVVSIASKKKNFAFCLLPEIAELNLFSLG